MPKPPWKSNTQSHNRKSPNLLNQAFGLDAPSNQQPAAQQSPVSPLPSPALTQGFSSSAQQEANDGARERFSLHPPQENEDTSSGGAYLPGPAPARSTSKRHSTADIPVGQTVNLVGDASGRGAAEAGADYEGRRTSYSVPTKTEPPQTAQRGPKTLKKFFGFGREASHTAQPNLGASDSHTDLANQTGIGRRVSRRRHKEPASSPVFPDQNITSRDLQQQQQQQQQPPHSSFRSAESSVSHLPPSSEEDENNGLDQYLEKAERVRPVTLHPPPKEQVIRGPLHRVNSEPFQHQQQTQQTQYEPPQHPQRQDSFHQQHYQQDHQQQDYQPQDYQQSPQDYQQPPQYQAYHPATGNSSSNSSQTPLQFDHTGQVIYSHQQDQQHYPPPPPPHQHQYQGYDPQVPTHPSPLPHPTSPMPPPPPVAPSRHSLEMNAPKPPQGGLSREVSSVSAYGQNPQGQGPPPNTNPAQFGGSQTAPGQHGQHNQHGQNYRGGPPQQQHPGQQNVGDLGRNTPPLTRQGNDDQLDVARMLQEHETLQQKYKKVKTLYFDRISQVEQLQDTLAHQRLAQSRTSLDDNEYTQRFNRLDGAINNLAFNIRKDWKAVPPWLQPVVNQDAHTKVTKEMTVVGRAWVSCWIVDEILERHFHPCLDPVLSTQLKIIEKNIRRLAPPLATNEEDDALLAKVSNWRLTTLDALRESLDGQRAIDCRQRLTDGLTEKLTASLSMHLKDPPPPGLEGGVRGIIELSVGIAANLPLESRDVFVEYFYPGSPVNPDYMKIETSLPQLTNPGTGLDHVEGDQASLGSAEAPSTGDASTKDPPPGQLERENSLDHKDATGQAPKKKTGMFGNLMSNNQSKRPSAPPPQPDNLHTQMKQAGGSQVSLTQQQQQQQQQQGQWPPGSSAGPEVQKVRVAGFMAVEVRGRSILVKAPVWVQ
ncbi:hypothetical protein FGG08_003579 [Glutinoglossum americanum]|uniref:Uncharacterized protein n=1 Tax=Glutinoglossum americanum TaxID=1670608 RepID=A0A9P8HXY5_9PEZI|nr:hypothetical protein FGG08_003579 [Glutinoglossum americanum]